MEVFSRFFCFQEKDDGSFLAFLSFSGKRKWKFSLPTFFFKRK